MSKSRTVGTQGEHEVARILNRQTEQEGFSFRWRRIESGRRPGSDIEAFDPGREQAHGGTYQVWEPHIEVRRRRTWDRSGWTRSLLGLHGTRWVLWMRPRDARVKGAHAEVRMHRELVRELYGDLSVDLVDHQTVDLEPVVDMTEEVAAMLLVRRAALHHAIKRRHYWREDVDHDAQMDRVLDETGQAESEVISYWGSW